MAELKVWSAWLESQKVHEPLYLTPLEGGMNNRGYRVDSHGATYFLKHYRSLPRLMNEYQLLELLRDNPWTPGPLAQKPEMLLGLYEFIHGSPVTPTPTSAVQALRFLDSLQEIRGQGLGPASDACLKLEDHRLAVMGRVQWVEQAIPAALRPAWEEHRKPLEDRINGSNLPIEVEPSELVVSASDFGFHNALQLADGSLRFLDLEYGGMDEPAKVVCDFFAQPRIPAPLESLPDFVGWLPARARTRLPWMWPLTVLKWACIIIKPLLEQNRFAPGAVELQKQERALQWLAGREAQVSQVLGL